MFAAADGRAKLERLCRYITRPAVSTERLSLTAYGLIHYRLKTPHRDGTTHVVFEPLDFMARPAARVPTPRVNLTRYHGVFAPNHHLRKQATSVRRGPRHAAFDRVGNIVDSHEGEGTRERFTEMAKKAMVSRFRVMLYRWIPPPPSRMAPVSRRDQG